MWNVAALVRKGLRWRRRRRCRRTARVVDEGALGHAADGGVFVEGDDGGAGAAAVVAPISVGAALARALLALACNIIRFDSEDGGGATEEAWAASGWRPRADEVSHIMVRESMRYAIYA
ncbi:hypothetical protein GUJ93_ZPchr0002g24738 [Zizania palustris]|uniref:Uncharacterized protein n=1 Tax=Zizania palustris TaxID=103762 RepID=A0A8J5S889_ZIZPA|nr:hypothetical protein GUJ93_ZPchr0002g24738 [Zizania palustris]